MTEIISARVNSENPPRLRSTQKKSCRSPAMRLATKAFGFEPTGRDLLYACYTALGALLLCSSVNMELVGIEACVEQAYRTEIKKTVEIRISRTNFEPCICVLVTPMFHIVNTPALSLLDQRKKKLELKRRRPLRNE